MSKQQEAPQQNGRRQKVMKCERALSTSEKKNKKMLQRKVKSGHVKKAKGNNVSGKPFSAGVVRERKRKK